MELNDLEYGLKSVGSAGHQLNCQEICAQQAGLTILRCNEQYDNIFLWGKVFGQKADYYIAYGLRDSNFEFPSKNFYVAMEGKGVEGTEPPIAEFEFQPLNRLTEEVADRIIALGQDKIFTGVPTTLLEPPVDPEAAGDPPPEGDQPPAPPSLNE